MIGVRQTVEEGAKVRQRTTNNPAVRFSVPNLSSPTHPDHGEVDDE
jgi:hypothetical protein